MKNVFLKILAPFSLVFLFAACGDDSSSSPDPENASSDSAYSQPASDSDEDESSDSREGEVSSSAAEEGGEEESSSSSAEEESSSSERYAWQHLNKNLSYGELVDETDDGPIVYKTIKIGNHTWMAENMRSISLYSNDRDEKYGDMYLAYQVECPSGWHVPSMKEWQTLFREDVLDGVLWIEAGASEKNYEKCTNASGFSALPGGTNWRTYREEAAIDFLSSDTTTWRETSTGITYTRSQGVTIGGSESNLRYMSNAGAYNVSFYVRCIMDPEGFDYIVNYLEIDLLGKPEMNCSETLKDKTAYVAHDYKKAVCKQDESTLEWSWVKEDLDWMKE
ncbi:MAG: hypothetical protein IJ896_14115 [Fibrobacter sp.]|nr:hypothetical protein [Fibrobacter sp.]